MKAHLLCPSKHLEASDLGGERIVTIRGVGHEKVGPEQEVKGILYLHEFQKGMVIGRNRLNQLITILSDETDDWINQQIILYPTVAYVDFGETTYPVPSIGVRGVERVVFSEVSL